MYTTENKTAKRFDYNAYIQGRLAGKYVIAYIDEDIYIEPLTEHINDSIVPFTDIDFDTVPSKEGKSILADDAFEAFDRSSNFNILNNNIPFNYRLVTGSNFPFQQMPDINCRGAP
ncbi:hypothetical protein Q765_01580 [Flavobacterium rivuli WB 3.3-2 = DSM 21788]|uniref:Uncharacterized protein n=1 Tax=Flavobacterium rivuli WB 3.3-2 = DSM 21788 TaxID=1121895 RepID=A0A0A2MJY6_9FLAO|nr:hypothetical protein [Flavobacterium rivuli]KGO88620.1 hypothetical protein Q765_01580 [Flavobacterium rivuli WB 3.3-2 = DSM 21788]